MFGTTKYFTDYIENQLKKEGETHSTIYRIHFSMTQYIFETFKGKEAINMLKNLNEVCERYSRSLSSVSPYA